MILHLYEDTGPGSTLELDRMFAFVLGHDKRAFAARDPLCIKPLYYGRNGDGWVLVSEIKVLLGEASDIREFPPGSWLHTKMGIPAYYEVPEPVPTRESWKEHASRLRGALEDAVHKRLMADVPVGVFLSGALDSSIIAAPARREMEELHTFSVGVAGSSDLQAARDVAKHLGTRHHEIELSAFEVPLSANDLETPT